MILSNREKILISLLVVLIVSAGIFFGLKAKSYFVAKTSAVSVKLAAADLSGIKTADPIYVPPQKLANPPEIVKAIYVTGYSAGTKKYLAYLTDLFKNTEINTVVVDIKGSDGYVTYASGASDVKKYDLTDHAIPDIDALVNFLHSQNIYVIGRIANFEDPVYSKAKPRLAIYNKNKTTDLSNPVLWQDNNGLSWLDPASKDVWNYNISLAKDAFYHGFDEVNFDYVRFPSDGKSADMGFPVYDGKKSKSEVIKDFFQYVRTNLPNAKISVDLFGQTTTNIDDMGIGQIIENAFENFDYISPMAYPSHYINGFDGFDNPAEHPYEIVKYAMDTALTRENAFEAEKQDLSMNNNDILGLADLSQAPISTPVMIPLAKFRPWLQDFNMGAEYTADMVDQEIKATQDALGNNYSGFMLWNAGNIYTQSAVLK